MSSRLGLFVKYTSETSITQLSHKLEHQKNTAAVNFLLTASSLAYASQEAATSLDLPMERSALGAAAVTLAAGVWSQWRSHKTAQEINGGISTEPSRNEGLFWERAKDGMSSEQFAALRCLHADFE
jgi:hypothetical protein